MTKGFALLIIFCFMSTTCIMADKPVFATPTENTWMQKTSFPREAGIVGAAEVNGKIYVISGSANYEYNPVTDSWTNKTVMPTPRWHFGIAVYQNKIYTIGGWYSSEVANEVYDPLSDTWKIMKPMPRNATEKDSKITACVVGNKIYSMGLNSNYVYDITSDSWTIGKAMPFSFSFASSSTVYDDKIYCIGGNTTQIYDPKIDSWSLGASPPTSVSNPAVCSTTGRFSHKRIYVFGGETGFLEYTNKTQVYSPESNYWTLGSSMPTPRGSPAVAVVNDQIYVIGGGLYWGRTETTNELYVPFGYGTPDPTPTTSASPSPTIPEFPAASAIAFVLMTALAVAIVYKKIAENRSF